MRSVLPWDSTGMRGVIGVGFEGGPEGLLGEAKIEGAGLANRDADVVGLGEVVGGGEADSVFSGGEIEGLAGGEGEGRDDGFGGGGVEDLGGEPGFPGGQG